MEQWGVYKIITDNGIRIGIEQLEVNGGESIPLAILDTQDKAEYACAEISMTSGIPIMNNNIDMFLYYA